MDKLNKDCYVLIERALRIYLFYLLVCKDFATDIESMNCERALTRSILSAVGEHLQNTF